VDGFSSSWTILKLSMPTSMFLRVTPTPAIAKGRHDHRLLQPSFPFTFAFALDVSLYDHCHTNESKNTYSDKTDRPRFGYPGPPSTASSTSENAVEFQAA
jgi:hypothetical protein